MTTSPCQRMKRVRRTWKERKGEREGGRKGGSEVRDVTDRDKNPKT